MSVQTLYTAATGINSLETKLDVIANNLANINTVAFKKDRANFEDLFYRHIRLPGTEDSNGNTTSTGISVGLGSRVSSTQTDFDQGAFQQSGNQLDVAIEGKGFFTVLDSNGDRLYTRAGNFGINANRQLVVGSANNGWILDPAVDIPQNATAITISPTGEVQAQITGTTELQTLTTIQLATFINSDGLEKLGDNVYRETGASGPATLTNPGTDGTGILRQGALEASNVEPVQELIDLITTQRAFELNSQVVQAGDQIMQLISNLRRA
ncbi:MAG: flagellar basal-body rod protein FlgG [Pirellulales bacterium]|nr:flagellar basal-body rod protein FlgG [Pirellulales bacterium]